jgi:hypothetical protein
MIKLNITYYEFIAIFIKLEKMFGMQQVSNELLHSKVDIVRQYGHDDFIHLLEQLKNNKLAEPTAWLEAIRYLYNSNKIQFRDEALDIQEEQIDSSSKTSVDEEDTKIVITDTLEPHINQLLNLILLSGCVFFFYKLNLWYAVSLSVLLFYVMSEAKSIKKLFFAHKVIEYNNKIKHSNNRMETEIRNILASGENLIAKGGFISMSLNPFSIAIIFGLFLLYGFNQYTVFVGLGIFVLNIFLSSIAYRFFDKQALTLAKKQFLSTFPYNHPQHEKALKILKKSASDFGLFSLKNAMGNVFPKFQSLLKKHDFSRYKDTKLSLIEKLLELISKDKPFINENYKDRIKADIQNILVFIDETQFKISKFGILHLT